MFNIFDAVNATSIQYDVLKVMRTYYMFIYAFFVLRFIMQYNIWMVFINKCSYNSYANKDCTMQVIKELQLAMSKKHVICFGEFQNVLNNYLPHYAFNMNTKTFYTMSAQHSGTLYHTNIGVLINVYKLNKQVIHYHPPLTNTGAGPGKIFVSDGSYKTQEICYPKTIDHIVLDCSQELAEIMCKKFTIENQSQIFLVSGPPGCGKSTSNRILANKLNGVLFSDYDPTRSMHDLWSTHGFITGDNNVLIVVMEEMDIMLEKIVSGTVSDKKNHVDIIDKVSWNNMLDKIKRVDNIVLIMNTNKSIKEIKDICKDPSYLRKHRVDCYFEINDRFDIELIEP